MTDPVAPTGAFPPIRPPLPSGAGKSAVSDSGQGAVGAEARAAAEANVKAAAAPTAAQALTGAGAAAGARATGGGAQVQMNAVQLVEARLLQALSTPGGVRALSPQDIATLSEIATRTVPNAAELGAQGQPIPPGYGQISPERAAELLARLDPAAVQRAQGLVARREYGVGAGAMGAGEAGAVARAKLVRWIAVACLAAMGIAFLLWVRG